MDNHIDEIEFTIFDTETTGLEPQQGDRIIEIAAIKFKKDKILGNFESLINPLRHIPKTTQNINHITDEMVRNAPTIDKIIPSFLEFIQGSYLCAYNASFDFVFLQNELKLINLNLLKDTIVVDLLKMSKRLLPGLPRYALRFVAENLGIKTENLHRAFADVMISFEIFKKLKNILLSKGICDVDNFSHLFALNGTYIDNLNYQKMAKIQEAIDIGVKLKIKYLSHKNALISERKVIPKEIRHEGQQIYLVGYCLLRNQERTFSLDGILHLEII
ncbi:MAG: exonuclease domain-containing protein [Candidatus Omnitrophica bacterium]|nr:exonuclease domain-containing protein [Candidatus Omnitrophota bacterium]